jgi:hypothetical protein
MSPDSQPNLHRIFPGRQLFLGVFLLRYFYCCKSFLISPERNCQQRRTCCSGAAYNFSLHLLGWVPWILHSPFLICPSGRRLFSFTCHAPPAINLVKWENRRKLDTLNWHEHTRSTLWNEFKQRAPPGSRKTEFLH